MKYEDEKIMEMKKLVRKRICNIAEGGLYTGNEHLMFKEYEIFDRRIGVLLPEKFVDMPEEVKEFKYPKIGRPQIIKTNLDVSTNFSFNLFEETVDLEQARSLAIDFKLAIKKLNPAAVFYDEISEVNTYGLTVNMFDFKGYGLDEQIYNIVCVIALSKGILHGIFNCPNNYMDDWKNAAYQVFWMIREIEKST